MVLLQHCITFILSFIYILFNINHSQTHPSPPTNTAGVITCGNSVSGYLSHDDNAVSYEFIAQTTVTFKTCKSLQDAQLISMYYQNGWTISGNDDYCNPSATPNYIGQGTCIECPTNLNHEIYTLDFLTPGTIYYLEFRWFCCGSGSTSHYYQIDMECPTRQPTTHSPTTTIPTTSNPTNIPTTIPTTYMPTTNMPTTIPTTFNPTTHNPTTNIPTIIPTTHIPTTDNPTTRFPTRFPSTIGPTTYIYNEPTFGPNRGSAGVDIGTTDFVEEIDKNIKNKQSNNDENLLFLFIGIGCFIICIVVIVGVIVKQMKKHVNEQQINEIIKTSLTREPINSNVITEMISTQNNKIEIYEEHNDSDDMYTNTINETETDKGDNITEGNNEMIEGDTNSNESVEGDDLYRTNGERISNNINQTTKGDV